MMLSLTPGTFARYAAELGGKTRHVLLAASTRERSVGCARCTSSPTCLCCTSQRSAGVWTERQLDRSIGVGRRLQGAW